MELILGNHLKTEQTQKLVLNTEIIQSLNLLQFTSNELADYIAEEMTDNPLLDFGEEESSVYHMVDADRIMNPDEEPHIDEYNGYGRESDTGVLYADPQEWQRYSEFNGDGWAEEGGFYPYHGYGEEGGFSPYHGYGDFDDSPYDLSVSDEFTLEESLLNQVDHSEEPYLVRATAAYIVQTLDENGYMTFSVPEIAQQLNISEELAEEARRLLWTFDPPGVGAVDLQECMKIQLRAIGRLNDKLSLIIDEHLPSLARGRYSAVARAVGMTPKDVGEAAEQRRYILLLVRHAWLYVRAVRRDGELEVICVLGELCEARKQRRGVLRPEDYRVHVFGAQAHAPLLTRIHRIARDGEALAHAAQKPLGPARRYVCAAARADYHLHARLTASRSRAFRCR